MHERIATLPLDQARIVAASGTTIYSYELRAGGYHVQFWRGTAEAGVWHLYGGAGDIGCCGSKREAIKRCRELAWHDRVGKPRPSLWSKILYHRHRAATQRRKAATGCTIRDGEAMNPGETPGDRLIRRLFGC